MQSNDLDKIVLVIPCYKPPGNLPGLVTNLQSAGFKRIVIVDDGSPLEYQPIFQSLANVTLLKNTINKGKGSALKKAFAYALHELKNCRYVLSCDDDGQHSLADITNLASQALNDRNDFVWLGSRYFKGRVPFKSKFGNVFMKLLLWIVTGKKLKDTQTGLRCLPIDAVKLIYTIPQDGFNFELIALLQIIKNKNEIKETPIETIYFNKNQDTRFRSGRDSLRVVCSCLAFYFRK